MMSRHAAAAVLAVFLLGCASQPPKYLPPTVLRDHQPKLISTSCVLPAYPKDAIRANQQGSVVINVYVDEGGHVSWAEIASSSGYESLDSVTKTF